MAHEGSFSNLCHDNYEPVADGGGAGVPGDAGGSTGAGVGETAGAAVVVPLFSGVPAKAGMGRVWGTVGAEVSGWMGMGMVLGAF